MSRGVAADRLSELQTGHEYIIVVQYDNQRFPRRSRMSFLARDGAQTQWNARPAAGTQSIPARYILSVEDIGQSLGRDDPRRYVNHDARIPEILCPPCAKNDCRHHQHDYLDTHSRVTLCRCPAHGKAPQR